MADDLSSIEGLADKHVRALNRGHGTGLRELAHADPEVIYWQDDTRSRPEETAPDPAEWQTTASFVVVFSQRRTHGIWERRVEAERTEVEPERATEVWSGWHTAPVCAWLADQLGQANGAGGPPAPAPGPPSPAPGPLLRAGLRDGAGRAGLRVPDGLRSGRAR